MKDHYATLGVSKNANQDEIKKAFRKLASQHHPDKGGDTARFQEIQSAYDTLGDADKRAAYDNPQPQFGGFGGFSGFGGPGAAQFNDIFSQMFGGHHHARRNHVRMTLWVSLVDAARGGSKTVHVGTSHGSSTVEIEIPVGIEDGDNVQYGGIAPGGMDLVVQFRVHPDHRWRRQGQDLYTDLSVSIWDLILGADIEFDTILGARMSLRIPPNTQPGTTMRVRGQGMNRKNSPPGDAMLKIQAEIPKNISPELLEAIKQHR